MKTSRVLRIVFLSIVLGCVGPAFSQSSTGSISGTVTDQNNAVVLAILNEMAAQMDDSPLKRKKGAVSDFWRSGKGMAWVFKGIRTVGDMAFC